MPQESIDKLQGNRFITETFGSHRYIEPLECEAHPNVEQLKELVSNKLKYIKLNHQHIHNFCEFLVNLPTSCVVPDDSESLYGIDSGSLDGTNNEDPYVTHIEYQYERDNESDDERSEYEREEYARFVRQNRRLLNEKAKKLNDEMGKKIVSNFNNRLLNYFVQKESVVSFFYVLDDIKKISNRDIDAMFDKISPNSDKELKDLALFI